METLFSRIYPKDSYPIEQYQDKIVEVYGRFFKSASKLGLIVKKLAGTVEWKKVMCLAPDDSKRKVMVFVANTPDFYLSGLEFKDDVSDDQGFEVLLELNHLLFWVDLRMMIKIKSSVIDNRPDIEQLMERFPGMADDFCKKLGFNLKELDDG